MQFKVTTQPLISSLNRILPSSPQVIVGVNRSSGQVEGVPDWDSEGGHVKNRFAVFVICS